MFNWPNFFSFLRIPLAFAFLVKSVPLRSAAVLLALLSDGIDGYLARKYKQTSFLGTILDPFSDRFFFAFAWVVLFLEHQLPLWKMGAVFARDGAIFLFGLFVLAAGKRYDIRAIWCGKIATVCQLILLFALTWGLSIPNEAYYTFYALGVGAFLELIYSNPKCIA